MRGGTINKDRHDGYMGLMMLLYKLNVLSEERYQMQTFFDINPLVKAHKLFIDKFTS